MTSILGDGSAIRHPKPDKAGSAGLVNVFSLSAKPTEAEPPGAPKNIEKPGGRQRYRTADGSTPGSGAAKRRCAPNGQELQAAAPA
jgi:hypothetical protein